MARGARLLLGFLQGARPADRTIGGAGGSGLDPARQGLRNEQLLGRTGLRGRFGLDGPQTRPAGATRRRGRLFRHNQGDSPRGHTTTYRNELGGRPFHLRIRPCYGEMMTIPDSAAEETPNASAGEEGNARAYSVSELSQALKRTLEDAYGFVRVRAEVSKVTRHASGHIYLTLKDERAAIDGVVWKGQVRALQVQPQHGMEVIVTGRITTYPASSKYQIVIETMAPAGVGALLAQLERLKATLQAGGLFDPARKRPLPSMPATIGVITSPTGAVIRDILHRIRDRWPCRVVVWPVVVQGEAAAAQVAAAIQGFSAVGADRPDVLIVARGGGSVEDLWAFNDEALARAVFEGTIPLISAVGHETDTTLIDFVSDQSATPPASNMVSMTNRDLD